MSRSFTLLSGLLGNVATCLPHDATTRGSLTVTGLCGCAPAIMIAGLARAGNRSLLVVTADQIAADELTRELLFCNTPALALLPAWEGLPFGTTSPHPDLGGARLDCLFRLLQGEKATIVAPIAALMQRLIPRSLLASASCALQIGDDLDRDQLLSRLLRLGYTPASLVEERGRVAVRGGIIDLFPPSLPRPVRIELFGDTIETLRSFDPVSQRSLEPMERLTLLPSRELILTPDVLTAFLPRLKARADELDLPADRRRRLAEDLQRNVYPDGIEYLQPLLHPKLETIFDYLDTPLLVLHNPAALEQAITNQTGDLLAGAQNALAQERLYPQPEELYLTPDELDRLFERQQQIAITRLAIDGQPRETARLAIACEGNTDLKIAVGQEGEHPLQGLARRLKEWQHAGWRCIIVCHQIAHADRLRGLLAPYGIIFPDEPAKSLPEALELPATIPFGLALGELARGCRLPDERLVVIAEEGLFGKRVRRKSGVSALRSKQIMASLAELKPGDAMVHIDHGIGIYRGLQHLKTGALEGDFLLLEYAGNDKLYLPIDRLGLVQRYVGGEGAQPHPAKLGGTGWEKTRSKAKKAVEELAAELLEIYAKRQASQGFAFSPPDELYREFEATFPWEETPDQLSAIMDVLADMQHSRPMDRLVCGDVGYGKTEVALRAAFKAVLDGKQVAVLVPTTILAQQHFETFTGRLNEHPVTVEMLSRFRTTTEQKAILERVKKGEIDIIIGTHRLLQKDVAFKDLGLLIVDEEQRFGVKDKDRLKRYRASVDIMTLTATPIPRTLHMSMMGIRDLSIIDTPPVDRQAIRTVVARDSDELVQEAVRRELQRDGQVFFVHNRVQSIGLVAERLRRLVPEARIAVAHGQMEEKELEKVMLGFMHGQTNLLLCTTIIESGLDIPRANTMIVDRADTYGLSQLYQLRGRIGRSSVRGEAYLLIPGAGTITQDARERLKIIQEITELGAGFRIATHDLELRGAGDLLGPRQSGAVADIGFEYYNQLLEEAIAQLKGEALEERCEPEINLAVAAYIPESYVPDTNQRLMLYKRLVQAETDNDITETMAEMSDRYGRLPQTATTLGDVMGLRIRLKERRIQKLESDGKRLIFTFHPATPVHPERLISLIRQAPATYQFTPDHRLLATLPPNAGTAEQLATAATALAALQEPPPSVL